MLEPYLKKHAESLDEDSYRVSLKQNADKTANEEFSDGDYFSTPWFRDYFQKTFELRLAEAGINLGPASQVLDVCCGHGHLGTFLMRMTGANVTFCDLSSEQLSWLAQNVDEDRSKYRLARGSLLNLPFRDGSFDLVIGNSFLHHLSDVPAALNELRRVQNKDGRTLLLHEPGISASYFQPFPISLFKNTEIQDGAMTDLWRFSADDLRRLFLKSGYTRVKVTGTGIASSILLNWYLILALKLDWRSRIGVYPAYLLRAWIDHADRALSLQSKVTHSPSLMVDAS